MTNAEEETFEYFVTFKYIEDAGEEGYAAKFTFTLSDMGISPSLWGMLRFNSKDSILQDYCRNHAIHRLCVEWQQRPTGTDYEV